MRINASISASKVSRASRTPQIFVSHVTKDAKIAKLFADLIIALSGRRLKVFRSSDETGRDGIPFATGWYKKIERELGLSAEVVCLITPNSARRPWILYEAGYAHGATKRPNVFAIGHGVTEKEVNDGPFSQFQNPSLTITAMTTAVLQLLKHVPDLDPDPDAVRTQVEHYLDHVARELALTKQYDLFIAAPMASVSRQEFATYRDEVSAIIRAVKEHCGFQKIFFAGSNIDGDGKFDFAGVSLTEDFQALCDCQRFMLFFPKRVPSSVLFEAGMAYAMSKPSVYFVKKREDLPFLMQEAEQAKNGVRIYEIESGSDIVERIRKHKLQIFPE